MASSKSSTLNFFILKFVFAKFAASSNVSAFLNSIFFSSCNGFSVILADFFKISNPKVASAKLVTDIARLVKGCNSRKGLTINWAKKDNEGNYYVG